MSLPQRLHFFCNDFTPIPYVWLSYVFVKPPFNPAKQQVVLGGYSGRKEQKNDASIGIAFAVSFTQA